MAAPIAFFSAARCLVNICYRMIYTKSELFDTLDDKRIIDSKHLHSNVSFTCHQDG